MRSEVVASMDLVATIGHLSGALQRLRRRASTSCYLADRDVSPRSQGQLGIRDNDRRSAGLARTSAPQTTLCAQIAGVRISPFPAPSRASFWEGILGQPTFKQILDALKRQVLFGKSYMGVAKGLSQADPVIMQTASTFFGLTMDGSLELAQMAIAKLYDRTKGAVTIPVMLARAVNEIGSFQNGDREEIIQAIKNAANHTIRSSAPVMVERFLAPVEKPRQSAKIDLPFPLPISPNRSPHAKNASCSLPSSGKSIATTLEPT